jgi:Delta24(24(1))-sterol reductase
VSGENTAFAQSFLRLHTQAPLVRRAQSSIYLYKYGPSSALPPTYYYALFAILFAAYYVWDTAQSQKNHFRLQHAGTVIKRVTFPMLPWAYIDNAKYMSTAKGTPLLLDGA